MKVKTCKVCGKPDPKISRRGYCLECAKKAASNSITQQKEKKGKHYRSWVEGIKRHAKHLEEAEEKED